MVLAKQGQVLGAIDNSDRPGTRGRPVPCQVDAGNGQSLMFLPPSLERPYRREFFDDDLADLESREIPGDGSGDRFVTARGEDLPVILDRLGDNALRRLLHGLAPLR